ncbi:hypothetical protein SAE01_05570 [Segetibacter aerophilus]|uniref:Uncharacterized protein n=2 Tax=Segetibacter aerophilus TaxID=670293 RepID=A0A512B7X6_9BACT|nr:hypothetical protein SAE01_05570 [Segetibacter aerophilus]
MTQELYVFTEPASNMAAKSIGLRMNNFIMKQQARSSTNYNLVPEIMVGVSKKIMVHGDAFLSNRNGGLATEGGSIYMKYRFLSNDDIQKHFRMAVFGRYSFNNSHIDQEEINLYGRNTGFETGIVATQLLHKVALSSAVSFLKAADNGSHNKYPYGSNNSKAVNYTLSAGKLLLPKEYTDYKQTNVNLMLELLNQYNIGSGKYYMDVTPSVQLIFNSVARIDVGYRQQLSSTYLRTAPNGLFIRLEYNFFNVY